MDEINNNLKKLQSEVTQINNTFQKESDVNKSNDYYLMLLDFLILRFVILLLFFYGLIYFIDPDFCYDEIINEDTYFKERKYNIKYALCISVGLAIIIFFITYKIKINK